MTCLTDSFDTPFDFNEKANRAEKFWHSKRYGKRSFPKRRQRCSHHDEKAFLIAWENIDEYFFRLFERSSLFIERNKKKKALDLEENIEKVSACMIDVLRNNGFIMTSDLKLKFSDETNQHKSKVLSCFVEKLRQGKEMELKF